MKKHSSYLLTLNGPSFLDELAKFVCEQEKPENCAVVLPSFRAVETFKRSFARAVGKPSRIPFVMTLGAFMEGEEDFVLAENLEVLARLYAVQLDLPQGREGFHSFLNWGPIALADFHSIDQHLLDANKVFKNLKDIKDIEEWSFDSKKELTKDQKVFRNQWNRLPQLYKGLHEGLEKDGTTTKAKLSKYVAQSAKTDKYDRVFAAGLAALTPTEELYLKKWREAGKLEYLPDGDVSYVNNPQIESGYFIRNLKNLFTEKTHSVLKNTLSTNPPNIQIIGCSSVMSSCQYVRKVVSELSDFEKNQTVIVVPDASSLPVLLQTLPYEEEGYNVTMGLSLRETPIFPFLSLVNRMITRGGGSWKFEDLMSISSQQLVVECAENDEFKSDSTSTLHRLANEHAVWVSPMLLKNSSKGPFSDFISKLKPLKTKDAREFLMAFGVWSQNIDESLENSNNPWVKAGWKSVRRVIGVIGRLQDEYAPCETAEDVRMLMQKLLSVEKINLIGEPAKGIQVMGLTETRALDYDRVLVLDCNEGLLPKHEIIDSYIPGDLKNALGMPGRHEREAAFAYSLYRLLNRSSEVHLLHRTSGKEGAEVSRYVYQFLNSFKPVLNKEGEFCTLPIEQLKLNMLIKGERPDIPALHLTDKMRERLNDWTVNGMSPSALNKMLSCERNFTYRYLLKLSEPFDLEESMQSSTIGSIVHQVFEEGLYAALNTTLQKHHIESILNNLNELLDNAVKEHYKSGISNLGENFLLLRSAKTTIQKLLKKELEELESSKEGDIVITGLEKSLDATYSLKDGSKIKFHGLADRIESIDGITRVVDYKTGITKQGDLNLKKDWNLEGSKLDTGKASKALQLLVYCAMILNRDNSIVKASIRSGRNARSGMLNLTIDKRTEINSEDVKMLIEWIGGRLDKLREKDVQFSHNEDSHYCEYCVVLDPPIKSF